MLTTRLCLLSSVRTWILQPRIPANHYSTSTRPAALTSTKHGAARTWSTKGPARVTVLRGALRTLINSSDDPKLITSRILHSVDRAIPSIPRPHRAYETIIRFLINHSYLTAAAAVHARMVKQGFIASPSLEARLAVVAMAAADGEGQKKLLSSIKTIVRDPVFTNEDLLELLSSMADLNFSPQMLNDVMTEYHKTRRSDDIFNPDIRFYSRKVKLVARSGNIQQALDTLLALPDSKCQGKDAQEAYTSFIAGIRDTQHRDREAVSTALKVMEQQGIEPDISLFNALISFETRHNSLRRPFAIYQALKDHPKVLPDEFTYSSLFSALNSVNNPNRRRIRHGRHLSDDVLDPRVLYRDMIGALVRRPKTRPFRLTTSLLNVALRSFIYKKDYVGAYVVLRCFTTYNLTTNGNTYLTVIRPLINRITYGIRAVRRIGADKWADRFLSLPYPIHDLQFLSDLQLSNALVTRILEVSSRSAFDFTWPLYIVEGAPHEQKPRKYQVPTVENMLSRDSVLLHRAFDSTPLERLLKKAILAELDTMRELQGQAMTTYLSRVIADAKKEMLQSRLFGRLKSYRARHR